MSNWRNQILREFTPNVARLTLVADPDGLRLEEGILAGIRDEDLPVERPGRYDIRAFLLRGEDMQP